MSYNYDLLRIDLSNRQYKTDHLDEEIVKKHIGGRGIATKIIWDEVGNDVEPLEPENKLILATGPLTGLPIPSSGKLVIAAKSPLTRGYGDGNIGTTAGIQLRKSGFDGVVFEGAAEKPVHIHISDGKVEFLDGSKIWGKETFEKEDILKEEMGEGVGRLVPGPAGENQVRVSTVMSQKGRAGGRTGMGAVMGSKNLAAVSMKGSGTVKAHDMDKLRKLGAQAYQDVKKDEGEYNFWIRQGTMQAFHWCQVNSTLPTKNFSEGQFEEADSLDGYSLEREKIDRKGCPNCNMQCGNVINDASGEAAELDYENVAMLGSNLGIGDIKKAGELNKICDQYGLDTISAGSLIGFAMEASQKGLIDEEINFGDFEKSKELLHKIANKEGLGKTLAEGTKRAAEKIGGDSLDWAMQVKGLEVSAYDCHTLPGMALAFGTAAIGAHHKESWLIAWEIEHGRGQYSEEVVDQLIFQQRKRGGAFESFTTCRLPWIELGFSLDWYEKFFEAATGIDLDWKDFDEAGDRTYSLIRSYLVNEYGEDWSNKFDTPPERWFSHPLNKGEFEGSTLDKDRYKDMINKYYEKRGWDENGVPKRETLDSLGLENVKV